MSETELLNLAIEMREAQRAYFRTRSKAALLKSKQLERRFDEAIAIWGKGQPALPF